MELAEYLTAYQDYWSENLSKLLAAKAAETVTVDAELLRLLAELDEPTYRLVLRRLHRLLEPANLSDDLDAAGAPAAVTDDVDNEAAAHWPELLAA